MTTPPVHIVVPDGDAETTRALNVARAGLDPRDFTFTVYEDVPTSVEQWVERTAEADAIILGWRLPDDVLRKNCRLKMVSFCGTGVGDHVNLDLAVEHGVAVRNVTAYGDNAVAEHALTLLLAVVSNLTRLDAQVRAGSWPESSRWEISGKRLGLVGFGGIARRFAELATACGMEVAVWARNPQPVVDAGYLPLSLDELFSSSDAVSVHLALTEQTRRIVDARLLGLMRPSAVFINTARGGLVDGVALAAVLENGGILGAGVDVFETEPARSDDPLLSAPRTTLTPHIAYGSIEAFDGLIRLALRNVTEDAVSRTR